MARTVGIGIQYFDEIIEKNCFYIDKTSFIKEWWERDDKVTLITRPRRFGKTLTLNMAECFFSVKYAGRRDLFEKLSIWQEEKYKSLQGTYPVISLSFASVKEGTYQEAKQRICQLITELYNKHHFLLNEDILTEVEKKGFLRVSMDMPDVEATLAVYRLSDYLSRYFNKKVIILLDEYDTPMQEAYVNGFWEELSAFIRNLFNATFKTNPYLERALMTGITRVSKESIFSDLNNLKVVTVMSDEYADCFGFTEAEVFASLGAYGLSEEKAKVKRWYDGFTFGDKNDIYNPWSILNYLDTKKVGAYWVNTRSNKLVGKLIKEASREIKESFEELLKGNHLTVAIDEQIVYSQLDENEYAIWGLLLASGYLKAVNYKMDEYGIEAPEYELALTNLEVSFMFREMVRGWFAVDRSNYNGFIKALLRGDVKEMNIYMNKVALATFSYFDTGKSPSGAEPERFYHGFVLGLLAEFGNRYLITSNRESGFGRYDVMLEPRNREDDGIILEFKVQDTEEEAELSDTVKAALGQIEKKQYEAVLIEKGIPRERIRKYGFAFRGKQVLIGAGDEPSG